MSAIITISLTLIIFVSSLLLQPSYGFSVTDQSFRPVQLTTTEQDSTDNITGFSEYIGFDKDFSLQYPSNWSLEPKTNRFESMDLKMTSPNGATYGFISMEYSILSPEMSSILKENDIKQKDIEKYLDLMFPHFLSGFAGTFDNFNQVDEPDYVKYQVGGHKTGSAVFGFTLNEQNLAGLMVWTLIGGNQFWYMYAASTDNFDQGLPTAEKVLESIKILPKQFS